MEPGKRLISKPESGRCFLFVAHNVPDVAVLAKGRHDRLTRAGNDDHGVELTCYRVERFDSCKRPHTIIRDVGASARLTSAELTSARAIATRCGSPPGRCDSMCGRQCALDNTGDSCRRRPTQDRIARRSVKRAGICESLGYPDARDFPVSIMKASAQILPMSLRSFPAACPQALAAPILARQQIGPIAPAVPRPG